MILCCRLLCRQSPLSVLHPPDPCLVLFCEDKWNIGEPELNFAPCLHCYSKWIKVWLLHSLWPIVLVDHLDTWLLDKIKKPTSDFRFQLRQSSFYQIFLQGATTKAEWNKIWLSEGIRKSLIHFEFIFVYGVSKLGLQIDILMPHCLHSWRQPKKCQASPRGVRKIS